MTCYSGFMSELAQRREEEKEQRRADIVDAAEAVYADVGRMKNFGASAVALDAGGTVGVGKTQNGVLAGLRHSF